MKAITTHFRGATNTRGATILARAEGVRTIAVRYDYGSDEPHRDAARAPAEKLGWSGTYLGGGLPDGTGRVFVIDPGPEHRDTFTVSRPE